MRGRVVVDKVRGSRKDRDHQGLSRGVCTDYKRDKKFSEGFNQRVDPISQVLLGASGLALGTDCRRARAGERPGRRPPPQATQEMVATWSRVEDMEVVRRGWILEILGRSSPLDGM